ncbi:hypothetical protein P0F40_003622, partial [Vibrio metschnikovii]|nr:hypothetical protein [Vibrio metschnikovii]
MFKIRNFFSRNLLKKYGLREAQHDDLDFVMGEIIEGTKKGHYIETILEPQQQTAMRRMLANVIENRCLVRLSHLGQEEIFARLFIYGSPKEDRVGYLLVSDKSQVCNDLEIYQAGVKETHLGQGHGRNLIDNFLYISPKDRNVFARCYPASKEMFNILIKYGFEHSGTSRSGIRELRLKK